MSEVLYAYADESIRPGKYLMSVVVVEAAAAGALRRRTRSLLLSGQRRLHFQKESSRRRRELIGELVTFDVSVAVFSCRLQRGRSEPQARAVCLTAIVDHLQSLDRDVVLYIERRLGRDDEDHRTMDRARRRGDVLTYQHLLPSTDPLLWLPDCFVWTAGAGGDWLRRATPAIEVIRVVGWKKSQTQLPTVRTGAGFTSSGPGPLAGLSMALVYGSGTAKPNVAVLSRQAVDCPRDLRL